MINMPNAEKLMNFGTYLDLNISYQLINSVHHFAYQRIP